MNLLDETIRSITDSGHTLDDVTFIGASDGTYACTWDEFATLADAEYDDTFGAAQVATDLVIRFTDGRHLWRGEYDGSEWWQYDAPAPDPMPEPKPITSLIGRLWPTLDDLNSDYPEGNYHRTVTTSAPVKGTGWIADVLNGDPDHPSTVVHVDGTRGRVVGWQEDCTIVTVAFEDGTEHGAKPVEVDEQYLQFTDGAVD